MRPPIAALVLITAAIFGPALGRAEAPASTWESTRQGTTAFLNWQGTAPLLGKPTAIRLSFSSDPTYTDELTGAVGFDLFIDAVAELAPFPFDSFEGPDAPAAAHELLQMTITRGDQPPLTLIAAPSGWYPDERQFAFGLAKPSFEAPSVPRELFAALAAGAEKLTFRISAPADPKLYLEFSLPVGDQKAGFAALLENVAVENGTGVSAQR